MIRVRKCKTNVQNLLKSKLKMDESQLRRSSSLKPSHPNVENVKLTVNSLRVSKFKTSIFRSLTKENNFVGFMVGSAEKKIQFYKKLKLRSMKSQNGLKLKIKKLKSYSQGKKKQKKEKSQNPEDLKKMVFFRPKKKVKTNKILGLKLKRKKYLHTRKLLKHL